MLLGKERGSSSDLPPTARRILDASRNLLEERGYRGLTFDAIAAESGSNKSMIRYYFGSKDGLIAALVDDLTHDSCVDLLEVSKEASETGAGLRVLLAASRRLMQDPSFKNLFDVLPEALRRRNLGESLSSLYEWYRETLAECFRRFSPDHDVDLRVLASLHMAIIDGLALQLALNEEDVDLDACWGLLESMTIEYLSGRLQIGSQGPSMPGIGPDLRS
ncbi:MAG: TetR/AcrR family transcriptional regulator [Thermoleophilia bacterium]